MNQHVPTLLTAEACQRRLGALPATISACYVLWRCQDATPVCVGTAKSPSRIRSHLQKDRKRNGNLGKLIINKPFYDFVMAQPIGWLGITFDLFDTDEGARREEQRKIALFGLRPEGSLFNRRASG